LIFVSSLPIILSAIGLSLLYYFTPSEEVTFKNAIKSGFMTFAFNLTNGLNNTCKHLLTLFLMQTKTHTGAK
jgi:uncharacterized membrane protein